MTESKIAFQNVHAVLLKLGKPCMFVAGVVVCGYVTYSAYATHGLAE